MLNIGGACHHESMKEKGGKWKEESGREGIASVKEREKATGNVGKRKKNERKCEERERESVCV